MYATKDRVATTSLNQNWAYAASDQGHSFLIANLTRGRSPLEVLGNRAVEGMLIISRRYMSVSVALRLVASVARQQQRTVTA